MDHSDKSFIMGEHWIDYIHVPVHERRESGGLYRLKVCLRDPASLTLTFVKDFLKHHLAKRPRDMDAVTQSMNEHLQQRSDVTDAEKEKILNDVVSLVRLIVRFGGWELSSDSTEPAIYLQAIRYSYWFRLWFAEYLTRIKDNIDITEAVSM